MAKSAVEGQNRQSLHLGQGVGEAVASGWIRSQRSRCRRSLRIHVLETVSGPLALTSRPIPPIAGPVDGLPGNLTSVSVKVSW